LKFLQLSPCTCCCIHHLQSTSLKRKHWGEKNKLRVVSGKRKYYLGTLWWKVDESRERWVGCYDLCRYEAYTSQLGRSTPVRTWWASKFFPCNREWPH
jgi:hypothetical protein